MLPKSEKYKQADHKIMPDGRFEESSTYVNHYLPSKMERNEQIRPEGQLRVGGNQFEGNSSYNDQYKGESPGKKTEKFIQPLNDVMPKGKFNGNSTY